MGFSLWVIFPTGVTTTAVPVQNTSSADNNSFNVKSDSCTSSPNFSRAIVNTEFRVIPGKIDPAKRGVLTRFLIGQTCLQIQVLPPNFHYHYLNRSLHQTRCFLLGKKDKVKRNNSQWPLHFQSLLVQLGGSYSTPPGAEL